MTGQLHNLTGTAMTADHERRIRDLERRLSAKQTNLPRRAETGAASLFHATGPNVSPGQTITDATDTTIDFDTIVDASADVAAVPGEPGTYEVQPGYYVVSAAILWEGAGATIPGQRTLSISAPGAGSAGLTRITAEVTDWAPFQAVSSPFYTATADWVFAYVRKDGTSDTGDSTINRAVGHLRILRVA